MYKNLLIFYVGLIGLISLIYGFYFWNGNLYNALLVEQHKGLKEWLIIIGSIGISPLIFMILIMNVKIVWSGSLFTEEFTLRKKN